MNFLHPPPRALSEENRLIASLNNLAGAMSTKGEANCLQQRIAIAWVFLKNCGRSLGIIFC
ncbi:MULTISPECIES: hypothetical protein [Dolichospermum]|uniref:Uncharacterized protein n=1 Tax=Dolichospermum heterosporum TAC447 TaxID=747523 RepID=A0ABY5LUU1_9CYAN|nr:MULTISPECIES: hypothetical protein [Dolichospermum]MBE9258853.1 hypothetical protein [Dolichospermum sp. LEGE 00246]UUO15788.1 hypothetical protein NG743_01640 [Dolichospermum heterosporum TAC447]